MSSRRNRSSGLQGVGPHLSGGGAAALRNVATSRLSASRLAGRRRSPGPASHAWRSCPVPTERSIPRFHQLQHASALARSWPRRSGLPVRPVHPVPATRLAWRLSQYPLGDIGQLGFVEYAEVDIESAQLLDRMAGWGPQILWVQSLELIPGQLPYAPVRVLRLKDWPCRS